MFEILQEIRQFIPCSLAKVHTRKKAVLIERYISIGIQYPNNSDSLINTYSMGVQSTH